MFFKVNNIIDKKFKINEILEEIDLMQKRCRDYVDSVLEEGKDEEF